MISNSQSASLTGNTWFCEIESTALCDCEHTKHSAGYYEKYGDYLSTLQLNVYADA